MRNGYTIIDRSSSSTTTLCNITGQLSVGRRVWKLVTHQINQFLSFHHHYIISNQKHHCTALHCEYEATKMLMMDAMVCCISSVAVQNGDWKESADCRSNAEGSLQRLKQSLIESGTQVNSRLVIISFNFSFSWTVDPSVLPVRPVKEKKMALEMIINIIVAIYTT